jgi:hypothetical protein
VAARGGAAGGGPAGGALPPPYDSEFEGLGRWLINKDAPAPFAGTIELLCEAFGCTPAEALELPEDLTWEVLNARAARRAARAFEAKGQEMNESEAKVYKRMLDALDARAERLGEAEEL